MSEKDSELGIVSKADLGNGRKQITLKVDPNNLPQYFDMLNKNNIKYEVADDGFKLGKGSVQNRYLPNANDWLTRQYDSNYKPYTYALQTPMDPHRKIELAIEIYKREPIVATAIDMMVDFSASGFVHECEDNDIKLLFDKWAEEVRLQELIEQIFLEYWRSGNVFIYRSDKYAKVSKQQKDSKGKVKNSQTYKFPAGYTILNPMNVYIEGTLLFNQVKAYLAIGQSVVNSLNSDNSNWLNQLPPDVANKIDKDTGRIPLDPKLFTSITRKKQSYERYANPFLERVFEPVLFKHKLRLLDMSMVEGMVNQLVTVTVGNDEYPAGDEDLEAIAELFNTPNKAYTIFWNHTLQVQFHKPEGFETLGQAKYQQVDEDILAGLGINRVLIDGGGSSRSSMSNGWVATLSLIERLDNTRYKVIQWLNEEYRRIAEENNLPTYPKAVFNKMNLREDTYVSTVLLPMYDRGLLDEEDVLSETGHDYDSIIETKKRNKKNAELFLPPEQPFQGGNSAPNDGKPKDGAPQKPMKERKTSPTQNDGNVPKAKAGWQMAYSRQLEEEYVTELADSYNSIKNKVANLIEQNKDKDPSVLDAFLVGALIGLFASLSRTSDKYIDEIYDSEIIKYSNNIDFNKANQVKQQLKNWNDSYVHKLAYDIKDDIIKNIRDGLPIDVAVNKVFSSNMYRVSAMSESVAIDTSRQAKIQGNQFAGMTTATWVAHIDDKTCSTCTGLNGKSFGINDIPARPHPHCRCGLDFK
jgi:hypothetical protein